jgi:hypothetical protein
MVPFGGMEMIAREHRKALLAEAEYRRLARRARMRRRPRPGDTRHR